MIWLCASLCDIIKFKLKSNKKNVLKKDLVKKRTIGIRGLVKTCKILEEEVNKWSMNWRMMGRQLWKNIINCDTTANIFYGEQKIDQDQ